MIGAESHVETSFEKNFSRITWFIRTPADPQKRGVVYGHRLLSHIPSLPKRIADQEKERRATLIFCGGRPLFWIPFDFTSSPLQSAPPTVPSRPEPRKDRHSSAFPGESFPRGTR